MDETYRVVRLDVDGRFSADNMADMLSAIVDLYTVRYLVELSRQDWAEWEAMWPDFMHERMYRGWKRGVPILFGPTGPLGPGPLLRLPPNSSELRMLSTWLHPGVGLELRRVRYGSKGIADLAGIGVIVGHLKDFILRVIELRESREGRTLDNERRRLENDALRIQNARDLVGLATDLERASPEVRALVRFVDSRQDVLADLAEDGKLNGASLLDPAPPEEPQ